MVGKISFSGAGISFKFLIVSASAIIAIFAVLLTWFWNLQTEHIMEQVRKQAVILYKQIILTRHWVSENNGILVQKTEHMGSNPYLMEPDVMTPDGVTYTKVTPSILTTLLSQKAQTSDLYWFRLTNNTYLNPKNAPDEIEKKALTIFNTNGSEGIFETDVVNGKPTLRYLAPVFVTSDCVQCHAEQAGKVGDIGGCLSVFVPIEGAQAAIKKNSIVVFGGGMGLAMSLVGLLYIISRSLVFKRIGEIHNAISLIDVNRGILSVNHSGDELKEISDFCYMLDKKLRSEHDELELRIKEATQDLSLTKDRLETANKELEILNKAKTDFFSDISHELRTPLTAIKGAADIISRKYPSESPQYVEIIRRNTDHLTKLVVDFLDYSKIETGHLELDLKEYSIRDIIDEALKSSESEASRKSVIFVNDADDIRFCFDSTRMFQVMTNLLSNAVRFSPENGKITLTAEKTGEGQVKVVVEDQGPGVPREHQDDIFRKFYQIMDEKGYSFHKGSSGIGLAICKGLIEAHGGRIWVESKSSQGARFVLQIPMRQPR